jgi:hypothetical protein
MKTIGLQLRRDNEYYKSGNYEAFARPSQGSDPR